METLQLAQMLADLSDLSAADPPAAHALVNANKSVSTTPAPTCDPSTASVAPAPSAPSALHRRIASTSSLAQPSSSSSVSLSAGVANTRPAGTSTPFDSYLGRRLLTPPITGTNSSHGSIPGTPRENDDVERAASLVALYELRAKLKQYNDSNSLRQARDKIAALSARQQQNCQQQATTIDAAQFNVSPAQHQQRPPPVARRHSQYTYPRT